MDSRTLQLPLSGTHSQERQTGRGDWKDPHLDGAPGWGMSLKLFTPRSWCEPHVLSPNYSAHFPSLLNPGKGQQGSEEEDPIPPTRIHPPQLSHKALLQRPTLSLSHTHTHTRIHIPNSHLTYTQSQVCMGTDTQTQMHTHRYMRCPPPPLTYRCVHAHTYTRRDPTGTQKHRAMINVPSEKEIISNKLNYCGSKLKNKDVNEV